jgi:hypothetical protein
MIGQFGINRCPVLDNYGKKDCGVVLAVLGAWNELVWLLGEPRELMSYRSLRGCTAAFVFPPIGSHFFITHGADVFLHNGYSTFGMFFHPACNSCSWLAAMPTGRHSPVPRQLGHLSLPVPLHP